MLKTSLNNIWNAIYLFRQLSSDAIVLVSVICCFIIFVNSSLFCLYSFAYILSPCQIERNPNANIQNALYNVLFSFHPSGKQSESFVIYWFGLLSYVASLTRRLRSWCIKIDTLSSSSSLGSTGQSHFLQPSFWYSSSDRGISALPFTRQQWRLFWSFLFGSASLQ